MDRPPEERLLVDRITAGDDESLKEAITAYGNVVFGMAAAVTRDLSLAEEVAQDTFLALWMNPGSFDTQRGSLRTYLLRIARYKAIDRVRQNEARRDRDRATTLDRSNDREQKQESSIIDDRDHVQMALESLSEVQRQIVVLTFFGGRSCREAADELGIPEGTAKTRLRDALIKLRSIQEGS